MQEIGTTIADFMKEHINVIDTKTCAVCKKEYRIIEYLDNKKEVRSVANDCPYCRKEREEEEMRNEAIRQKKQRMLRRFENYSEVPFGLESETFEKYIPENESQKKALELTKQFVNGELEKTTLFFQGDTGIGKTHLSYCTYKSFLNEGAIFIDLPSLLSDIRNTYNTRNDNRAKTQEDIMKAISDCELMVLDDIGAEYVKPDANGYESWAADILFQIVNSRQGKKNIYTTNFTSKHLTKKYGMMSKRIISRMMSNAKVIKVEGDDHRLKGLN